VCAAADTFNTQEKVQELQKFDVRRAAVSFRVLLRAHLCSLFLGVSCCFTAFLPALNSRLI
jgi:hypothetical protein